MLPRGLEFSNEQLERINTYLSELRWDAEVKSVVLADVTGQLVDVLGHVERLNVEVLSALVAGEIAATREVAQLVGEEPHFRLVLHEGRQQSIYLSPVGNELLLAVIFENTTPIGMVRIFTQMAADRLWKVAEEARAAAGEMETVAAEEIDEDFGALLAEELDISFS